MTASLMDRLAALPEDERVAWLSERTDEQLAALKWDWSAYARPEQMAPPGDWDVWMCLAGRGWGKTRTGAEWIRQKVASGCKRVALIAETSSDARDVMVEGESGLLSVYPKSERPLYQPSKRRLTWPNGASGTLFNATEPDQLRGPQFDVAWCDELAKWRYARETWDMLQFGLRLGSHPQALVTTTPRPIELVKAILAGSEGKVVLSRGATFENAQNLAGSFLGRIKERYEGTRLGRQELNAEILADIPNALWPQSIFDVYRREKFEPNDFRRVLVAVDPAVTQSEDANEHGIVVGGVHKDGTGLVLADGTCTGGPRDWASRAISLATTWNAEGIVVEVNQGGDMVKETLKTVDSGVNVIEVRASKGKVVRAEPIAALYEQGRIAHLGSFADLEVQMTQMTTHGFEGKGSPDRVDALVWLFTELFPSILHVQKKLRMKSPQLSMV